MGLFRQGQADKLVAMRRGVDRGTATEAELAAEARKSTGLELDDAMEQYGADGQDWGH